MQAIAASPEGAVNGYAIGSFLYLGIIYAFPVGLALGGLAMDLPVLPPLPSVWAGMMIQMQGCLKELMLLLAHVSNHLGIVAFASSLGADNAELQVAAGHIQHLAHGAGSFHVVLK